MKQILAREDGSLGQHLNNMITRTHIPRPGKPFPKQLEMVTQDRILMKPIGLWYGIDGSWETWCKNENEDSWLTEEKYELEIDLTRVLVIGRDMSINEFDREYILKNGPVKNIYIDWKEVSRIYKGIEIPFYSWEHRHALTWYYGWDIASGCIWDPSCIQKITKQTRYAEVK